MKLGLMLGGIVPKDNLPQWVKPLICSALRVTPSLFDEIYVDGGQTSTLSERCSKRASC